MSPTTRKTLAFAASFTITLGLLAGSYKLGAHHQAVSDRSSFSDYLAFVEQQDLSECKDAIYEEAVLMTDRCEKLLAEQCPTSSENPVKAPALDFNPPSSPF
jgi:hypothetical protein